MKITTPINIDNVTTLGDVIRYSGILIGQMKDAINGGISYSDNIACAVKTVSFTASGAELRVSHNLGSIPFGYIKVGGANITVYDSSTPATKTDIYLKATGAGSAKLVILG